MMGQVKALYQLILRNVKRTSHVRVWRMCTITSWNKNGLQASPKKEERIEKTRMGKGKQKKKNMAKAFRKIIEGFFSKKS